MAKCLHLGLCTMAFVLAGRVGVAQDLLLQPRPGELLIGPQAFQQAVFSVPLNLRASAFLVATPGDDRLRIDARVVADLADLQNNVGRIVDTIPLPKNNCDNQGGDNLFARIWGKRIAISGNTATLVLNGDVEWWFLCGLFKQRIQQPFDTSLPFHLETVGPHAIAVRTGSPDIVLGGSLGGVSGRFLQILGVDVNDRVKAALDDAIDPKLLQVGLPEYLLWLNPVITKADLVSNNGTLAASVEMNAVLDPQAIVELVLALLNRPDA